MSKVMIAIPHLGWIRTELAGRVAQWAGQKHAVMLPGQQKPVDYARNKIVQTFIKSSCSHLLMVDADTIPPEDAVEKMLKAEKDIISGITRAMIHDPESGQFVPVAMALKQHEDGAYRQHIPQECMDKACDVVEEVDRVGGSCLMLSRTVVERMVPEGPLFLGEFDALGYQVKSEDVSFCDKARALGFKVYAHYGVKCQHIKECGV